MTNFDKIKEIHIELTTLCNSRCPLCVRNANGFPHNFGYPEVSLTLEQVKQIFKPEFIRQLEVIKMCGNFGDFIANQESLEIIEYFVKENSKLLIEISTNGGARGLHFWKKLAEYQPNVHIFFCLDGLEDTHSKYRLDTSFNQIIKNAQAFIDAGGPATWKMILFEHNKHQVYACQQMSKDMGFKDFNLTDHGRTDGNVFDRDGIYQYDIGTVPKPTTINHVINWHIRSEQNFKYPEPKKELNCYSNNEKSIYVAANGEVYPCCYLGFYPKTFANGSYFAVANNQLADILKNHENNALIVGLENAIAWFNDIEQRWKIKDYAAGRLLGCDNNCGSNKYKNSIL